METLVLRSCGRLSSLAWLWLGLGFGLPFIAVGLQPGGKIINLFIGTPLLIFFFGLALWDLGHSQVLTLDRTTGTGLLLRGHYHQREKLAFSFKDVSRLVLAKSKAFAGGKDTSIRTYHDLRIELKDGRALSMPLPSRKDPRTAAFQASVVLQVPLEHETQGGFAP